MEDLLSCLAAWSGPLILTNDAGGVKVRRGYTSKMGVANYSCSFGGENHRGFNPA
jgi:hypothetical protein